MTQPTSEALSDEELADLKATLGVAAAVGVYKTPIVNLRRLLATLDQALARCEAAEARAEALLDPKPDHHFAPRDEGGHNCIVCDEDSIWKCDAAAHMEIVPRWEDDPVVVSQGWNTPERCGNCGEVNERLVARCEAAERRAQLDPTENMVLTIALAQIERGDDVPPNTTAALVFALARIAGREGFDAAQPEPDTKVGEK